MICIDPGSAATGEIPYLSRSASLSCSRIHYSLDPTKIDLAGNGDAMDVELSGNTPPDTTKGRFLPFHSFNNLLNAIVGANAARNKTRANRRKSLL
jgi:hypothetical protein